MLLGRVVGTVVASRKEPTLEGLKFLLLRQLDVQGRETGGYRVAADAVGVCCQPSFSNWPICSSRRLLCLSEMPHALR